MISTHSGASSFPTPSHPVALVKPTARSYPKCPVDRTFHSRSSDSATDRPASFHGFGVCFICCRRFQAGLIAASCLLPAGHGGHQGAARQPKTALSSSPSGLAFRPILWRRHESSLCRFDNNQNRRYEELPLPHTSTATTAAIGVTSMPRTNRPTRRLSLKAPAR